jgi:hypothetical protein
MLHALICRFFLNSLDLRWQRWWLAANKSFYGGDDGVLTFDCFRVTKRENKNPEKSGLKQIQYIFVGPNNKPHERAKNYGNLLLRPPYLLPSPPKIPKYPYRRLLSRQRIQKTSLTTERTRVAKQITMSFVVSLPKQGSLSVR